MKTNKTELPGKMSGGDSGYSSVTGMPALSAIAVAICGLFLLSPVASQAASVFTGPKPTNSHTTDKTAPVIEVSSVAINPFNGTVTIAGKATDNRALNVARWSSDRGGSGEIIMKGSYTAAEWIVTLPALKAGINNILLEFADETGNNAKKTLSLNGTTGTTSGTTTPNTPTTTPGTSGGTTTGTSNGTGTGTSTGTTTGTGSSTGTPTTQTPQSTVISNPILFAAEVPTLVDFGSRASTFGNHLPNEAKRGGDLVIRYPNGVLRNLTQEAGFSNIAVREPSVNWEGTTAIFSMVTGGSNATWQMYEVLSGLRAGEQIRIVKVANQPADYNNVSPIYGTNGRILFTSDRPRSGIREHYPQRDEYESAASVTGLWSINPTVANGDLKILNHTPSGMFSPSIDSFGRVISIRWDHLQQDQQVDIDRESGTVTYGAFNYADESATAAKLNSNAEFFPEPRRQSNTLLGPVYGFTFNHFTPWQMNEDGTEEETINHMGRHEFNSGYMQRSFMNDPALSDSSADNLHLNRKFLREDGGMFHIKEDPKTRGTYYGISAREFGSLATNQIIKFNAAPGVNPEEIVVSNVTMPNIDSNSPQGRFRNPVPLSSGPLIASHTAATTANVRQMNDFRLRQLNLNAQTNLYEPGAYLTSGVTKNGVNLWEIEAVEVVARQRPVKAATPLETPESSVLSEEGIDETALRNWMKTNDLALIVTRNITSRDRADKQQPFNLRVPGGVSRVAPNTNGKTYDIAHLQVVEAKALRGYATGGGRRVLAQPMDATNVKNPVTAGPKGSVQIASDGSTAAFVPANRALAWQTTTPDGVPVVRERVWVTFQKGEIRVCASCHGVNKVDQAGFAPPLNKPEALRTLMRYWKTLPK